jgi:hypothetical protein
MRDMGELLREGVEQSRGGRLRGGVSGSPRPRVVDDLGRDPEKDSRSVGTAQDRQRLRERHPQAVQIDIDLATPLRLGAVPEEGSPVTVVNRRVADRVQGLAGSECQALSDLGGVREVRGHPAEAVGTGPGRS